jgi:hypoxanthine phosphoribosyltransferase
MFACSVAAVSDERERLGWDGFGSASRTLASAIHDDGFEPDLILAIARGGLLVAGALGYALSVKNLYTMNVEYYTGVDERLDVPMILPPIPDPSYLANAQVLIADDVADTGHTLAAVQEFCKGKVADVRCAVLYEKPRSVVKCEYVWRTTDRWIEFPWSDKEPVAPPKSGHTVRDF